MGYGRPEIRYFKWEKDRFSIKKNRFLWNDNNSPPERLQEIQFSENKLCKKTREIIYLKFYPPRKPHYFYKIILFTEKNKNISPSPLTLSVQFYKITQ